ncbi:class F sortase [Jiangella ureilytica]|uniref:Class F sortase n=1 Tax=Jiangella ureilytica TaxID=2530374 RepID=A0A4V2XX17_9ACTN|nr:class F sortase [Jiangella ureilytica]TDC51065.1 class F sortase [Jiangella ureilytica]
MRTHRWGAAAGVTLLLAAAYSAAAPADSSTGPARSVPDDVEPVVTDAGTLTADAGVAPEMTATPAPSAAVTAPAPVLMTLLGQDVALEPAGLAADGSMSLPPSPDAGGWWAAGAAPGDGRGTVVVAGHVDTAEDGPGIFAELATMSAGDRITITTSDERVHAYTVTELHSYAKEQLPPELFSRNGPRRLVLITCTGPFDDRTASYTRNLAVVAAPTR